MSTIRKEENISKVETINCKITNKIVSSPVSFEGPSIGEKLFALSLRKKKFFVTGLTKLVAGLKRILLPFSM